MVSKTLSSNDDDDEEGKQMKRLKQVETRRRLMEPVSKRSRSWLHVATRSYEREWQKERKKGFDPTAFYIGAAHMEAVRGDCGQRPCKHDVRWE